jgi:hypothetical protein
MPDMHQSMSLERVCRDFHLLYGQITGTWGRIEVTVDGEKDACVLMSKAELEALERALEILCELPGGQTICKELEDIAARSTDRAIAVGAMGNQSIASGDQSSL